ncbi:secreted protein [Stackebrandtia albiflava]|uniref:Secreted protein n=2 Tax=Stackebrandtia albiflava TaxID=406432 RepID=A0A562URV4_9ACTN|nr:secreted protein [Stackebrandtia albiflava]
MPHHPRVATVIGRLLIAGFLLCLVTGLYSHYLQDPLPWQVFPTRPVWLYRVSHGLHVATGTALIPLLLAKLWTVYPRLFAWPPLTSLRHGLERASVALLVSSAVLQLFMGLLNTWKWYPWPFSFRTVHFWLAWVVVGALLIHVAVKLPLIVRYRRTGRPRRVRDPGTGWTRRGFLTAVGATTAAVTVTTVGQAFTPLGPLALLAPRQPGVGPQGLPVNRTAAQAAVTVPDDWRLEIVGATPASFDLAALRAFPQHDADLPISCVEGWSQSARWSGVRVRDLLDAADAPPGAALRVVSLQTRGSYAVSHMTPEFTRDPLSLLALRLDGEVLHIEHGYPARIITAARPGVLQTKWVYRLEVLP